MDAREEPETTGPMLLVGLIVLVVLLWFGYWWWLSQVVPEDTVPYQNRGQFGDMFGGLNALFSALAFAGLLYAIALQRNELTLQRRELELTRVELQGQKEQLEAQNKILRDTTVHQVLVSLLNEYRSAEMMVAVRALWDLKREHPADVVAPYEAAMAADKARIESLPEAERLQAERQTMHFRRRLVSQYYQLLGGLYYLGVVPRDVVFTHWERRDLRIISEILLPIEKALAKAAWGATDDALSASVARMLKLFEDAPPDGAAQQGVEADEAW